MGITHYQLYHTFGGQLLARVHVLSWEDEGRGIRLSYDVVSLPMFFGELPLTMFSQLTEAPIYLHILFHTSS